MFGKNKVAGRRSLEQGFLVKNIWHTIQGEGPLAGLPAIFVRFADCNLRCFFCDTDFDSVDAKEYTLVKLCEALESIGVEKGCSLFVLTGGEPLLQEVFELMAEMAERACSFDHWHFQIETAGTIWPENEKIDPDVFSSLIAEAITIVCSPKTPKVHPMVETYCADWKYIIRFGEQGEHDGLPTSSTQNPDLLSILYRPAEPNNTIWVQPCDEDQIAFAGKFNTAQNMQACVRTAMKYGYRLSLQLHKIVGVE